MQKQQFNENLYFPLSARELILIKNDDLLLKQQFHEQHALNDVHLILFHDVIINRLGLQEVCLFSRV
jgi:hypothetical protein